MRVVGAVVRDGTTLDLLSTTWLCLWISVRQQRGGWGGTAGGGGCCGAVISLINDLRLMDCCGYKASR